MTDWGLPIIRKSRLIIVRVCREKILFISILSSSKECLAQIVIHRFRIRLSKAITDYIHPDIELLDDFAKRPSLQVSISDRALLGVATISISFVIQFYVKPGWCLRKDACHTGYDGEMNVYTL